jgi:hypothetical protein
MPTRSGGPRYLQTFQLAVLELERARRQQERTAARQRLDDIETRLAEIEALLRAKQESLARNAGVDGGAPARESEDVRSRVLRY